MVGGSGGRREERDVLGLLTQTFQTTSKERHGLSLSDAVGVDGLTLSSKPSIVIILDGLNPYLL